MAPQPSASTHADLHTHTRCSDGTLSPAALVGAAADRGLRALSVTDHDTLAGVSEAQAAAEERGLQFVSGVELSVNLQEDEIHLLAYGMDPSHEALQAHIERVREDRRRRAWAMVDRLREHGLSIADDHLQSQVEETTAPGRPHVAAALVAAGHVDTVREAFKHYLGDDGPGFVSKTPVPVGDVLSMVHRAGGVGVLAHPGQWTSSRQVRALVDRGLDGIEIYHPSHPSSLERYYQRLARGHDLIMTGGSDYHGRTDNDEQHFGTVGLSAAAWERFWAAVA